MTSLNEAVNKIKSAGISNTRITTVSGNNYQIEVFKDGKWEVVVNSVTRPMAEDIVRQATNKVILG